jgi:hypothetical protein
VGDLVKGLAAWLAPIDRAGSASVAVGYFGETAKIAAVQEYGAPSINVPARPFFSRALRSKRIRSVAAQSLAKLRGGSRSAGEGDKSLAEIADAVVDAIRSEIDSASSWATADKDGDPTPLNDSGRLRNPRIEVSRRG